MTDAQLGIYLMIGTATTPGFIAGLYAYRNNDLGNGLFFRGLTKENGEPALYALWLYAIAAFVYGAGVLLSNAWAMSIIRDKTPTVGVITGTIMHEVAVIFAGIAGLLLTASIVWIALICTEELCHRFLRFRRH